MPVTSKSFVNRTKDDIFGIALDLDSRADITGLGSDRFRDFEFANDGRRAPKNYCTWQWPVKLTPCNPRAPRHKWEYCPLWIAPSKSVQVTVIHKRRLEIGRCEWLGDRLRRREAHILDIQINNTVEPTTMEKIRFKWTLRNPQGRRSIVVSNLQFKCYEYDMSPEDREKPENTEDPHEIAQKLAPAGGRLPDFLKDTCEYRDPQERDADWNDAKGTGTIKGHGSIQFWREYKRKTEFDTFAVLWGQLSPDRCEPADCHFAVVWHVAP